MPDPTLAEREFIGRFGLFYEMAGNQRIAGMIIGWLLICDPPQQSITELASALDVSKASVSTVIRHLQHSAMVERHPVSGSRQHFYQLTGGGSWVDIIRRRFEYLPVGRRAAESGLDIVPAQPHRRQRLEEFIDFLTFLETELNDDLIERWERYRRKVKQERESE